MCQLVTLSILHSLGHIHIYIVRLSRHQDLARWNKLPFTFYRLFPQNTPDEGYYRLVAGLNRSFQFTQFVLKYISTDSVYGSIISGNLWEMQMGMYSWNHECTSVYSKWLRTKLSCKKILQLVEWFGHVFIHHKSTKDIIDEKMLVVCISSHQAFKNHFPV